MRFQSKYKSTTYVVKPAYKIIHGPGQEEIRRGLRAKFVGPDILSDEPMRVPSFFDSEAAQVAHGWTDDQRLEVERYLLTHRDFGFGLYLAHGESIPPEHADLGIALAPVAVASQTSAPVAPEMRCAFIRTLEGGEVWQCGKKARKDGDYCAQHEAMLAKTEA